jgi:hypothetical protein
MNNTYILLRNNSESTPLSLEDLKRIGLLPSDLLWVECQSVCWQHPQEIPELKKLLTPEEQPVNIPATEDEFEKYTPLVKADTVTPTVKNRVYVKLPSTSTTTASEKEEVPIVAQQTDKTETITAHKKKPAPEYAQYTINDILLDQVETIPQLSNKSPKDKTELLESLLYLPKKKIALYVGLLAAGALMMLIIKGTGGNEKMKAPPVAVQAEMINTIPTAEPVEETVTDSTIIPESYTPQQTVITETSTASTTKSVSTAPTKKQQEDKQTKPKNEPASITTTPAAKTATPVIENLEVKKVPVENIVSQLHLKANEYTVAAFGGIRNLKMTLQNNSRHLLEKVSVEIRYLNPEGEVVKTETIDFNSVPPGESAAIAVKKTTRGVKLDYKITKIKTAE